MRWPGPCMGPPEPGARPSLCGILGSLHSGKDPPGLHATSLAGMQARSSLPSCTSGFSGPPYLSVCPVDPRFPLVSISRPNVNSAAP